MEGTGPLCPRCRQPNAPGAMRRARCGQTLVVPPIQQFQVGTLILLQTQFNELAAAQPYRQLTAPGTPAFALGPGVCATCGSACQPEATFCGTCGARLGPQALSR